MVRQICSLSRGQPPCFTISNLSTGEVNWVGCHQGISSSAGYQEGQSGGSTCTPHSQDNSGSQLNQICHSCSALKTLTGWRHSKMHSRCCAAIGLCGATGNEWPAVKSTTVAKNHTTLGFGADNRVVTSHDESLRIKTFIRRMRRCI